MTMRTLTGPRVALARFATRAGAKARALEMELDAESIARVYDVMRCPSGPSCATLWMMLHFSCAST